MKHTKATAALLSTFYKVRILNYAAVKPIQPPSILKRFRNHGCPLEVSALNRILPSMIRQGYLKTKAPLPGRGSDTHYSLTPKGRAALNVARERLKNLCELLQCP